MVGVFGSKAFALSLLGSRLLSSVRAQLESCADIGCPSLDGFCSLPDLEGQELFSLGASRFQSQLSPDPLSWTVGDTPRFSSDGKAIGEQLVFYLGQPPTLNLREDTSVSACALFYDGIAPRLKFNHSENAVNDMTTQGTCNDALTAQCVSDLTQHATNLTAQLAGKDFTCKRLAESLHMDLPKSCKVVKGSWGDVEARNISGSTMSAFTSTKACNPTINSTYSATQVFTKNGTKEELFTAITPILTTIISASGSENFNTEVHLNCLKLIDDSPSSDSGFKGGSSRLQWSKLTGWLWAAYSIVMLSSMF